MGQTGVTTGSSATDGVYFMWHGNGSVLSQTTGEIIAAAGQRYQVQVDACNSWRGDPQVTLYYDNAGTQVALGSTSLPANGDTWPAPQTLSLTVTTTAASVGKNLGIALNTANTGNVWAEFDNVVLTAASDPIPWLYGNFTGNHVIDINDLLAFVDLWLRIDCAALIDFDLNSDCAIDLFEFSNMAASWLE